MTLINYHKELKMQSNIINHNLLVIDEALVGVQLSDRISVPTQRTITDAGQMHVPCRFARTGTQQYTAGQLGLVDKNPKEIVTVYRDEADVFDQASMESFRSAPVTIGHPKDVNGSPIALSAVNAKDLQVGMLEGMPARDEDTLGGVLVITAQEAIDAIEDDQELSAGYMCDIEEIDGKLYQRNIRANHIAIVAKGRAGASCRISDEALDVQDAVSLVDAQAEVVALKAELVDALDAVVVQKEVVKELKLTADEAEVELATMSKKLEDALIAAKQGVVERCEAIEQARLIADMRDLGDKSVQEIRLLVVADQYPEKDLSVKSEAFIEAMFEMLIDQAKGETPMSKLMKTQATHVVVDAKPVDKVAEAHKNMTKRQASLFNKVI